MATAEMTPLAALQALGQSVWIDFMGRAFVERGDLRRLIEEDGLQGATSNPTIFDKSIRQSTDYDDALCRLVADGADADRIYQELTVADIRAALDLFRPVYDRSQALDGYVSLEVSPLLAHDADGTLAEARQLWKLLDRPNAMIKIPGTPECLPAIEEALAEGININVTLLFSVEAYEAVAHAYIRGLQRRARAGQAIDRLASVASFFVSRIDAEVDQRLEAAMAATSDPERQLDLEGLMGSIAIANAKNAYAVYQRLIAGPEFQALRAEGARPQRLLWASVGTKNPAYPDTLYIDELIGPDTVSTMPPVTYDAFKDHGLVRASLTEDLDGARQALARLEELGIDFRDVTDQLLREGVASFAQSFEALMSGIRTKRDQLMSAG